MRYVNRSIITLAVILISILAGFACSLRSSMAAPASPQSMPAQRLIEVRAIEGMEPFRLAAPRTPSTMRAPTSTFVVHYVSTGQWGDSCTTWPANAQTAFSYAANIWGALLNSPVPVHIDACWATNLPYGVLGHSGASNFFMNFTGAPVSNTWYPVALANARHGSDLDSSRSDMYIAYSNSFNWYFGTDGNVSAGQYDLSSVALHEITHGLGFSGSMQYGNYCGYSTYGCWGLGTAYPIIYDRFTQDASYQGLINTSVYSNPSVALGNALKSNSIYFSGTNANAANGGNRVKLYAPSVWASGSSYSHLDYNTFRNTNNRLMVYAISSGQSIHDPGPVTMGLLQDVGWTTNSCYSLTTNVSPSSTGTINTNTSPTCNGTQYFSGTNVTLTAVPSTGYRFGSWSGSTSGSVNPTTVTISSNQSVTANFVPDCYTLTTGVWPSGAGSVNVNTLPNCNGTQYQANTTVNLSATPGSGNTFYLWAGNLSSPNNPTTLLMDGDKTANAYFVTPSTTFVFIPLVKK